MKKALTILMLALSVAAFTQNAPKAVVLDVFNKDGHVRQSTLAELKTNLAQAISAHWGYEGIVDDKVDKWLLAEGFANHPKLSKEQALWVANVADVSYAVMSEASIDNYGYLAFTVLLVDLDNYQVMTKETSTMDSKSDEIRKGCEALIKKIIPHLPEPPELPEPVVETEQESNNQAIETEEGMVITESMQPRPLTSSEADEVARHLNRADVCIEMNYIDNAIKEYDEIVKMVPFWANAYMYLANAYSLKNDETSLAKAMKNYKIFMQMTDDKELYYEAQDKLSRVEMMTELKGKESEKEENLIGTWRSGLHNKHTGQPWFVVDISKTSIPNKYQIILSPKSMMYSNIVNTKAYSDVIDGKISWSYTFKETYIPSQSKYNAAGAAVNLLFGNSFLSTIGGVVVETVREGDVGYTNIIDFDFIADVDIQEFQNEYNKRISTKYMNGSCQMKGEHHQSGQNVVELDTIRNCEFLEGDGYYPVFKKVKEIGGKYYYGDIKLTAYNPIFNYSPYLSMEEYEKERKKLTTKSALGAGLGSFALGAVVIGAVLVNDNDIELQKVGQPLMIWGGIGSAVLFTLFISGQIQYNNYLKQCYEVHNKRVDENIRKYGRQDQASVSVNVGLTPAGVGISLNF